MTRARPISGSSLSPHLEIAPQAARSGKVGLVEELGAKPGRASRRHSDGLRRAIGGADDGPREPLGLAPAAGDEEQLGRTGTAGRASSALVLHATGDA